MKSTKSGCGDAAPTINFLSSLEQPSSAQPASPSITPYMAATNVDTSFDGPHSSPLYGEDISNVLDDSGLPWPHSLDHNMMLPENSNYQICPTPIRSFDGQGNGMSCSPNHLGYTPNSPFSWSNVGSDVTRPRSCPDVGLLSSIGQIREAPSFVSMYQIQPQMQRSMVLPLAPTSEPNVQIQDDDYDQSGQPQDVLESIEPCGSAQHHSMNIHQPRRQMTAQYSASPFDDDMDTGGDDRDGDKSEPYAKSLFRCLRQAPNHTMILRDIYDWFRGNTDKGTDPHERGWQNSIRHNLSMNKASR